MSLVLWTNYIGQLGVGSWMDKNTIGGRDVCGLSLSGSESFNGPDRWRRARRWVQAQALSRTADVDAKSRKELMK